MGTGALAYGGLERPPQEIMIMDRLNYRLSIDAPHIKHVTS
jgi:hypothetical protein